MSVVITNYIIPLVDINKSLDIEEIDSIQSQYHIHQIYLNEKKNFKGQFTLSY